MNCTHTKAFASGDTSLLSPRICLGWYDGPTEGIGTCRLCGQCFEFKQESWDDDQDVRAFLISNLPDVSLNDVVAKLAPFGEPEWPEWLPTWEDKPSDAQGAALRAVDTLLAQADFPRWVVLTGRIGSQTGKGCALKSTDLKKQHEQLVASDADFQQWRDFTSGCK